MDHEFLSASLGCVGRKVRTLENPEVPILSLASDTSVHDGFVTVDDKPYVFQRGREAHGTGPFTACQGDIEPVHGFHVIQDALNDLRK